MQGRNVGTIGRKRPKQGLISAKDHGTNKMRDMSKMPNIQLPGGGSPLYHRSDEIK